MFSTSPSEQPRYKRFKRCSRQAKFCLRGVPHGLKLRNFDSVVPTEVVGTKCGVSSELRCLLITIDFRTSKSGSNGKIHCAANHSFNSEMHYPQKMNQLAISVESVNHLICRWMFFLQEHFPPWLRGELNPNFASEEGLRWCPWAFQGALWVTDQVCFLWTASQPVAGHPSFRTW